MRFENLSRFAGQKGQTVAKSLQEIWNRLSCFDISALKRPNEISNTEYLPWVAAHKILMTEYGSDYTWRYERTISGSEFFRYPDGTGEVRCVITICGNAVCTSQVVTTSSKETSDEYSPAVNPSASMIHNAKMRARVRCAAEGFGLGFSLWDRPAEQTAEDQGSKAAMPKEAPTDSHDKEKTEVNLPDLFSLVQLEPDKKTATAKQNKFIEHLEQIGRADLTKQADQMFDDFLKDKGWLDQQPKGEVKPTRKGKKNARQTAQ